MVRKSNWNFPFDNLKWAVTKTLGFGCISGNRYNPTNIGIIISPWNEVLWTKSEIFMLHVIHQRVLLVPSLHDGGFGWPGGSLCCDHWAICLPWSSCGTKSSGDGIRGTWVDLLRKSFFPKQNGNNQMKYPDESNILIHLWKVPFSRRCRVCVSFFFPRWNMLWSFPRYEYYSWAEVTTVNLKPGMFAQTQAGSVRFVLQICGCHPEGQTNIAMENPHLSWQISWKSSTKWWVFQCYVSLSEFFPCCLGNILKFPWLVCKRTVWFTKVTV